MVYILLWDYMIDTSIWDVDGITIDTSVWDGKEILDTSIYDGKTVGRHYIRYELIDSLKNLRSTLVPRTKELSLVILEITKLCLLYLFGCVGVFPFI